MGVAMAPLHEAVQRGNLAEVERLLQSGADIFEPDHRADNTCLHFASERGQLEVARMLVEKGGERLLMMQNEYGNTCLHYASIEGQLEVARMLFEKGGERLLMMQTVVGDTCLHYASLKGQLEVARMLVEKGGERLLMMQNEYGYTCLHSASEEGELEVVRMLFEKGGERLLMMQNEDGRTCLHSASSNGRLEVARMLLEKGGEGLLMMQDKDGRTCLHSASSNGRLEVARMLLEKGGERLLMMQDKDGRTCLHSASSNGHLEVARMLVEKGGERLLMMQDKNGKTALDLAKEGASVYNGTCWVRLGVGSELAKMLEEEMLARHQGGALSRSEAQEEERKKREEEERREGEKEERKNREEEERREREEEERKKQEEEERREKDEAKRRKLAVKEEELRRREEELLRRELAVKEEELSRREEELLWRESTAQQRAGAGRGVEVVDFSELELEARPLAAGSFKDVYRARWLRAGQADGGHVAVLVLRSRVGSMASEVALFESLVRHPHLCRLLATTVRPQTQEQCMVMEFAERGSLDGVLQDLSESGTDTPTHAVLLTAAAQVCEAMEQLGQHGVIHRDLAARNCLVFGFHSTMRRHVLVKVTDYGRAVAAGVRTVTTNSSGGGGPMRWMAPESIKFRRYWDKSDVFSFGTLMWEMWSGGEIPFSHVAEDEEVARRVMGGARPERPAECPDAVFAVMERCWKPNKNDRPGFAELKFDLQDALIAVEREGIVSLEDPDEGLCVVCLERPAPHALLPCGHRCASEEDAAVLDPCPI